MRSSVQKRGDSIQPNAKPNVSGILTTELRSNTIIQHPYKGQDSSGSQKGSYQPVERATVVRDSEGARATGSVSCKRKTTLEEKRKTLQRYKYLNPLARLDYQDKLQEVYTKYTKMSKASVVKKIKAKNRIAQFESEQQQVQQGFEELIDYKFGKEKDDKVFFEKEQIIQYQFCEFCDTVHNDHAQVHTVTCEKRRREQPQRYSPYSQNYMAQSLYRVKLVVEKIKSPQFQQLLQCILQLQKLINPSVSTMARNKTKVLESIRQLKQIYCTDSIFVKIIAKVCYLIEQL